MLAPLAVASAQEPGPADACDVNADVTAAYAKLLGQDLAGATAALAAAEDHLSCGIADPQALARFWLVEGALFARTKEDDPGASFGAAKRIDPDLWLPNLPASDRALWTAAAETGRGTLTLDVPLGTRAVLVDGQPWTPGELAAGLHAVQVTDPAGAVLFGTIAYVGAGTTSAVATGLPPEVAPAPVPVPAPPPPPPRAPRPLPVRAVALVGGSLSFGQPLSYRYGGLDLAEPGTKLVLPLELGVRGEVGPLWIRGLGGVGPLVGGQYLSSRPDGALHHTGAQLSANLAAGAALGGLEAGVATGLAWPGRLTERAVLGVSAAGPLVGELRVGVDLATAGRTEPAAELRVGVVLP